MNCLSCGYWKPLCKCGENKHFYTSRDKLWEFNTRFLNKEVEIRSKGQWKKYMKQHGLHDDVSKKPNFSKPAFKPTPRQEIKKLMLEKLQKDGTYHKLVPELRRALR